MKRVKLFLVSMALLSNFGAFANDNPANADDGTPKMKQEIEAALTNYRISCVIESDGKATDPNSYKDEGKNNNPQQQNQQQQPSNTSTPQRQSLGSDNNNGDWSAKTVTLKNTGEAELMIRVGDIDALNDENAIKNGYNPFTAKNQRAHSWQGGWVLDASDPDGTDRIYMGSKWTGKTTDGYAQNTFQYRNGGLKGRAFGDGAMNITMNYKISDVSVNKALLQLCIDDFQALKWKSNFTVKINSKDAPFIAELINQVEQTGPTSYIISAVIPSKFFTDISSGKFVITIDETTGIGDGFAVDFVKLLVNYNEELFTGEFNGKTEPGATVRLLGTRTSVTASNNGGFTFKAVPGLNAIRVSKKGYKENYAFGIVLPFATEWSPIVRLVSGTENPDIDFTQFGATDAWSDADYIKSKLLTENKFISYGINFDSGKDVIKPESHEAIKAIADVLKESPNVRVRVVGHTDTDGNAASNLELSKRRAIAVKNYLIKGFGINGSRIETDGKGQTEPLAPNTTSAGKAKNRRVEFVKI